MFNLLVLLVLNMSQHVEFAARLNEVLVSNKVNDIVLGTSLSYRSET